MKIEDALSSVPSGLREPLFEEYQSITQNYSNHNWSPSELSGGKFCEIVYTILLGYSDGSFKNAPEKPSNFVQACRQLETKSGVPRSFQILIPRLLPALYEVRNNRGVAHTGGEVNPNQMDATFVLTNCNWIMAELVRVFHGLSSKAAEKLVASLVDRRIPLIWEGDNMRRVLNPELKLRPQILILLATASDQVTSSDLLAWTGYQNQTYFLKLLRQMHEKRLIEFTEEDGALVTLLPPGNKVAAELVSQLTQK